jgi:hypothetical protein
MSPPVNHASAIVSLWVPIVVFAHVFAAFWFVKLFLLTNSNALKALTRRRRRPSQQNLPKQRTSEDDDGTEDVVLALSNGKSLLARACCCRCRRRPCQAVVLKWPQQ